MAHSLFTLWSRGRLLGEAALDDDRSDPGIRTGWLIPNDEMAHLIPRATINATADALMTIGRLLKSVLTGKDRTGFSKLEHTSEYADFASAMAEADAFALELRRADGSAVRTTRVAIMDTHRLIAGVQSIAEACDEDEVTFDNSTFAAAQSALVEWESDGDVPSDLALDSIDAEELPRYQVYVRLVSDSEIP